MESSGSRYDIKGFADELGVDMEGISGLFFSYIEEMRGEIDSMQEFLHKGDWYMLQRVVHNIKGVSANLGIMDVFSEAEKFDKLLKSNITQKADENVFSLVQLMKGAEKEIERYFDQQGLYK